MPEKTKRIFKTFKFYTEAEMEEQKEKMDQKGYIFYNFEYLDTKEGPNWCYTFMKEKKKSH